MRFLHIKCSTTRSCAILTRARKFVIPFANTTRGVENDIQNKRAQNFPVKHQKTRKKRKKILISFFFLVFFSSFFFACEGLNPPFFFRPLSVLTILYFVYRHRGARAFFLSLLSTHCEAFLAQKPTQRKREKATNRKDPTEQDDDGRAQNRNVQPGAR